MSLNKFNCYLERLTNLVQISLTWESKDLRTLLSLQFCAIYIPVHSHLYTSYIPLWAAGTYTSAVRRPKRLREKDLLELVSHKVVLNIVTN